MTIRLCTSRHVRNNTYERNETPNCPWTKMVLKKRKWQVELEENEEEGDVDLAVLMEPGPDMEHNSPIVDHVEHAIDEVWTDSIEPVSCAEVELDYEDDDQDDEPSMIVLDADAEVAKWWKQCQINNTPLAQSIKLPNTVNPHTRIRVLSRLPEVRQHLEDCIERILSHMSSIRVKDRGCMYAALASLYQTVGEVELATEAITKARSLLPSDGQIRLRAEIIERQRRVSRRHADVILSCKSDTPADTTAPPNSGFEVHRRSDLSLSEFYHEYAMKRKPVVITDIVSSMFEERWDLGFLASTIGHKTAMLKRTIGDSLSWAGLEDAQSMKIHEFIAHLQHKTLPEPLYLFDWLLPVHAPELTAELTIPRYFVNDFLQRVSVGSLYRDSWPSLFIGPAGSNSKLHVDAFGSNFWMALIEGRKRWIFFDPNEIPYLYPEYVGLSLDPSFAVDPIRPDLSRYPLFERAKATEIILEPGELLFVPSGCPHCVENLTDSIAISGNYVDGSNFESVKTELKAASYLDSKAAQLLTEFESPSFQSDMRFDLSDQPWDQFKRQTRTSGSV
eukprot:GILJ01010974.1.p1 GENE.GILJ01010974.1~~GILJ01010974.1.p1  ORF type:complete len:561 (+),score=66.54 GILJ01010974.1:486-2168(+)